jgi:hypothetical protein
VGKALPRWKQVPVAACVTDLAFDRAHVEQPTAKSCGRQIAAAASRPLRVRRWRILSKVVRAPVGSM